MLYPSIDSLLTKIDSKYSLVSVAAKRARAMQMSENTCQIEEPVSVKNVGRALEEINADVLVYELPNDEEVLQASDSKDQAETTKKTE